MSNPLAQPTFWLSAGASFTLTLFAIAYYFRRNTNTAPLALLGAMGLVFGSGVSLILTSIHAHDQDRIERHERAEQAHANVLANVTEKYDVTIDRPGNLQPGESLWVIDGTARVCYLDYDYDLVNDLGYHGPVYVGLVCDGTELPTDDN